MMCSATSERFVFVAGYSSSSRCGETALGLSIMWGPAAWVTIRCAGIIIDLSHDVTSYF